MAKYYVLDDRMQKLRVISSSTRDDVEDRMSHMAMKGETCRINIMASVPPRGEKKGGNTRQ